MLRLGIVDFDPSHVVQFTRRLNHIGIEEEQWVDGAKVVVGYAGTSAIAPQETVDNYTKILSEELGVELVSHPEEIIGNVDAVLIESVDGSVHLDRARPFIEAGLPVYIDKPFACCLGDAKELVALAAAKKVPLFSSSSLRYALEITDLKTHETEPGSIVGVDTYGPASLHPRNPGFFHYGIHGVEPLYALMGPGCESVWSVSDAGTDVVIGRWKDGRLGTVRGTRRGAHSYGFTAFCEKSVVARTMNTNYIYRELLKRIVTMFETGRPPIDLSETLEIVAFIEAAITSAQKEGMRVPVNI